MNDIAHASKDIIKPACNINNYYVSTWGNDSNDGSLAHPFATIDKASTVATPGTIVHIAPGTYSKIRTMASGTADAKIVYISDVKWGAKIQTVNAWSSWYNGGSYVDIVGFDVSGNGFIGIQSAASYVRVIGNHVHDIAQTGNPGGNGGAGIQHSWSPVIGYAGHDNEVIGNVIHDIGPAGQEIHTIHGIYLTNMYGCIENNMVYDCVGYGIHLWHATSDATIKRNLVYENRSGGIIVANGSGEGNMMINDNSIVSNNICINNHGKTAIKEGENDTGPNNRYINNIIYGNDNNIVLLNEGSSEEGTIYSNPQFVDYQPDGCGDYHFMPNSPAVPQDAYYNADDGYGYYETWNSRIDWSIIDHSVLERTALQTDAKEMYKYVFTAEDWASKQIIGESIHSLGVGHNGIVTIEFDFIPVDKTQDMTIGYAGTSTAITGWSRMSLSISNEIQLKDVCFTIRNGENYSYMNLVPITNGKIYHFRIIADLTAETYSVYVTPNGGIETAIAEDYAFRTDAPAMDDVGQLSFGSAFDDAYYISNHHINHVPA